MAQHPRHRVEQIADGDSVGRLEHGVGHDQEQADIEGHQRPDDVLGLSVLAASGGDCRRHFGVDHRHTSVEQTSHPTGRESSDHAAFADSEVPAHILADEHDADAERPDMGGAEHAQELKALGCGCGCSYVCHFRPPQIWWRSAVTSISPSRDEVSSSLS